MLDIRKILVVCLLLAFGSSYCCSTAMAQKTAKPAAEKDSDSAKSAETKTKKKAKKKSAKKDDDKKAKNDKEEDEPELPRLRVISLSGSYTDLVQPSQFNPTSALLGGTPPKQRSFFKLCKFIDDLAEKDEFDFLALDLSNGSIAMNGAQLDELARHLKNVRDAGKKTFAWLENASTVHLSIAANCDQVYLADFGSIDFPSLGMQSMFFRDAMDLLGVKVSVVRAGDFKGAVEPYVNPKMSDHLREHYEELLMSMNDALVDRIAEGRGMKPVDVRELQAKRMFLPKEALAAGLVDKLAPFGSMEKTITKALDADIDWVTSKKAAKKDVSFFQLMGQMMSGPAGSSGRIKDNTIAVLHLFGPIVDGKKASPGRIVSGPTVAAIEKLIDEDKVEGVVIRINSPGGSATASEAVRQALVKLTKAKPCVVSMGSVAASGGYWISCIDAPVLAENGTITGSIGVFSMKFSTGALMRRMGVHIESILLDDSAGLFALDRPWNAEDTEALQGAIDAVYDRFTKLVSDARGIKMKKVKEIAGGRVWSGAQAKRLKLVDRLGGVDDGLAMVAKKAKLDDDFNVIHRPIPKTGVDLSDLFGNQGEEEIWSGVSRAALQVLKQRGLSLESTRMLLNDALNGNGQPKTWLLIGQEISIR